MSQLTVNTLISPPKSEGKCPESCLLMAAIRIKKRWGLANASFLWMPQAQLCNFLSKELLLLCNKSQEKSETCSSNLKGKSAGLLHSSDKKSWVSTKQEIYLENWAPEALQNPKGNMSGKSQKDMVSVYQRLRENARIFWKSLWTWM